mmetsp:Transcript_29939/g.99184  ORF Transcript_29939/g.99184 Transcript_29939/m.99184 type:complete len:214 (-) Transcript_29939:286-927(-)
MPALSSLEGLSHLAPPLRNLLLLVRCERGHSLAGLGLPQSVDVDHPMLILCRLLAWGALGRQQRLLDGPVPTIDPARIRRRLEELPASLRLAKCDGSEDTSGSQDAPDFVHGQRDQARRARVEGVQRALLDDEIKRGIRTAHLTDVHLDVRHLRLSVLVSSSHLLDDSVGYVHVRDVLVSIVVHLLRQPRVSAAKIQDNCLGATRQARTNDIP